MDTDPTGRRKKLNLNASSSAETASLLGGSDNSTFVVSRPTEERRTGTSIKTRVSDILLSPGRFMQRKFKAGGLKGSIFNLITAILGSGTVTLPYLASKNGIILAILLIFFGAAISYFCGMLLVRCAEKVGSDKYEDFAKYCYGRKMVVFTGWCNVSTLLGFVVSYIVFIKVLIPQILWLILGGKSNVPDILGDDKWKGGIFWATVYSFLVLFPLSIPRQINVLRFNSLLGVVCSFYLVLCLVFLFLVDRDLVPDMGENFKNAKYFDVSFNGLTMAVPFVVFAFMYQPNIPIVYRELYNRNYRRMEKVIVRGSGSVVILYILACVFGYLGLVGQPEALATLNDKSNVLEVDYNNWAFNIAVFGLVFAIFAAAPVCVLPCKDTIEELFYRSEGMNKKQNFFITLVMCLVWYALAVAIPGISDVITILGCTTNPLIGFILPVVFYLKIVPEAPLYKKAISWIVLLFTVAISILVFVLFIRDKINGD